MLVPKEGMNWLLTHHWPLFVWTIIKPLGGVWGKAKGGCSCDVIFKFCRQTKQQPIGSMYKEYLPTFGWFLWLTVWYIYQLSHGCIMGHGQKNATLTADGTNILIGRGLRCRRSTARRWNSASSSFVSSKSPPNTQAGWRSNTVVFHGLQMAGFETKTKMRCIC